MIIGHDFRSLFGSWDVLVLSGLHAGRRSGLPGLCSEINWDFCLLNPLLTSAGEFFWQRPRQEG